MLRRTILNLMLLFFRVSLDAPQAGAGTLVAENTAGCGHKSAFFAEYSLRFVVVSDGVRAGTPFGAFFLFIARFACANSCL